MSAQKLIIKRLTDYIHWQNSLLIETPMTNQFTLRKAERKQAKIRIGLFGPSGSGKTMSALKLARGLANWDKIAVIDTENRSADLYSHLGDYNVMNIEAPFTPERYIEAIKACEQSGVEVIIVDSITHEWAGIGGILELVDDLGKTFKNSMQVWAKLTPRHNKFISSILESPCHMICCGRSKQDYVMNQVEKNGKIINVPEKVGLKVVTREGFDYEMTISFDIGINHYATISKDRAGLFMGKPDFIINEETGKTIAEWNKSGKVDPDELRKEIMRQAKRIGINTEDKEILISDIIQMTGFGLKEENFAKIIEKLKKEPTIDEQIEAEKKNKPAEELKKDNKNPAKGLIKDFQLKQIRKLALEKIKDDKDDAVVAFLQMYGMTCGKLSDFTVKQAQIAIDIFNGYEVEKEGEK